MGEQMHLHQKGGFNFIPALVNKQTKSTDVPKTNDVDDKGDIVTLKSPKTIYTNVTHAHDKSGRLTLNTETMTFHGKSYTIVIPLNSVHHYHVSPVLPVIQIFVDSPVDSDPISFIMVNRNDMLRLKMDLTVRLFRVKEEQHNHRPILTMSSSSPPDAPNREISNRKQSDEGQGSGNNEKSPSSERKYEGNIINPFRWFWQEWLEHCS